MKEFIEKLIGALEEEKGENPCRKIRCRECQYTNICYEGEQSGKVAIDNAIQIVNQLAEEYNQDSIKDNRDKTIGDCIRGMNNRELAVFLKPFMTRFVTEDEIVTWLEEEVEG